MSSYQLLGIDEQARGNVLMRAVAPTDLDRVSREMTALIKDYYGGVDWLNSELWRRLGWSEGDRTVPFLRHYMLVAHEKQDYMRPDNRKNFAALIGLKYPTQYTVEDLEDFTRALSDLAKQNRVPDSILKPWTYTPTTFAEDIGTAVQKAAIPVGLPVGMLAVAAIGAWAFFGGGFSQIDNLFRK